MRESRKSSVSQQTKSENLVKCYKYFSTKRKKKKKEREREKGKPFEIPFSKNHLSECLCPRGMPTPPSPLPLPLPLRHVRCPHTHVQQMLPPPLPPPLPLRRLPKWRQVLFLFCFRFACFLFPYCFCPRSCLFF